MIAAAIDAALDLVAAEPERRARVLELARLLRERLGLEPGSQIIPVPIGENDRAIAIAEELQRDGFDIRSDTPAHGAAGHCPPAHFRERGP